MEGCKIRRNGQIIDVRGYGDCKQAQDNNNNSPQEDNNNSMRRYSADRVQIFKDLRSNRSSDDSSEGWQILEADDPQLQCAEENDDSSLNTNYTNNSHTMGHSRELGATKSEKYIEIGPPSASQNGYDPLLIYLCTAVYSLVPLASVFTTFTLVGLLFTKLYYVTLLYFAYVLWDRNTCNEGK